MVRNAKMNLPLRIVAHLLFAGGLLVFIVLPDNKYSWMQEMDPSLAIAPVEDASGNRAVFTLLLLIAIVAAQLAVALKTASRTERVVSIILALTAISVWLLR